MSQEEELKHLNNLICLSKQRLVEATTQPFNPRMVIQTSVLTDEEIDKIKDRIFTILNIK